MKLLRKYKKDIINLGERNKELEGIYSSNYSPDIINKYIHDDAFTTKIESYVKRYSMYQNAYHNRFQKLFGTLKISIPNSTKFSLLDIGTGPGTSTIELLNLFPNAHMVSSDLSLEFLVHLKKDLVDNKLDSRCDLLQLNAEELDFDEAQFDFVFGVSVLHHLYNPEKTIEYCAKILKKNGHAIFYEPMKKGYELLYRAYTRILDDEKSIELIKEQIKFFKDFIEDYELRIITDKSNPVFKKLDDKWFFENTWFEKLAEKHGLVLNIASIDSNFSLVEKLKIEWSTKFSISNSPLKSNNPDENLEKIWNEREDLQQVFPEIKNDEFDGMKQWARDFGWNEDPRLEDLIPEGKIPLYEINFPDWVWDIIQKFENSSNNEDMFEGCIVLKK